MQFKKMISATITVTEGAIDLEKLFSFEDKQFQNKRANYTTKLEGGKLNFLIQAQDSIAMRSVLNTITKLLTIYEKTKKI